MIILTLVIGVIVFFVIMVGTMCAGVAELHQKMHGYADWCEHQAKKAKKGKNGHK